MLLKTMQRAAVVGLAAAMMTLSVSSQAMVDVTVGQQAIAAEQPLQFIVRTSAALQAEPLVQAAAKRLKLPFTLKHRLSTGDYVLALDKQAVQQLAGRTTLDVLAVAEQLQQLPHVEMASFDPLMTMQVLPDVSEFDKQWDLFEPLAGIDAPEAWNTTTGAQSVVVGIIDTGMVQHENFVSSDKQKVLPGYSFVRNSPDVTDDGVKAGNRKVYHGTHVAGTIGAVGSKDHHIAGIAWHARILPVQVLGSNGAGTMSQIIDGMRWAAGLPMKNGVPNNPHPAAVLNMSLGGESPLKLPFLKACQIPFLTLPLQEAVNEITNHGTAIIVAAGNGDRQGKPADAKDFFPASCDNVITVASVGRNGQRAFYSNYGSLVDLAAPGGDQGRGHEHDENGIYSTTSAGHYEYYQGTSMATPHVAGVAALMYSVNPSLTPKQLLKGLTASTKTFPQDDGELSCASTQHLCGAGMLNAKQAVDWAQVEGNQDAA